MTVVTDISMSLDGFVTAANPSREHGLGLGGEPIQRWVFNSHTSEADRKFLEAGLSQTGAIVMGRRTFDFIDGPHGWNDDVGYGWDADGPAWPPAFVVTHAPPAKPRHTSGFTFTTGGVAAAIDAARHVAGSRTVNVMGGADIIDQTINEGHADVIRIHLSPVLIGTGTRLFDLIDKQIQLRQTDVVVTPHATHLTYEVTS